MKLREFNPETAMSAKGGSKYSPARIGINFGSGCFRFNRQASVFLGLKEGDQVKLFQDKDEEPNWYVEKVNNGGFILIQRNTRTDGALVFNSAVTARAIAKSVNYIKDSGRCLLAPQPTVVEGRTLYGIITHHLRN